MKKKIFLFTLFCFVQIVFGQQLHLKIVSENKEEQKIIDSISYQHKHSDTKNLIEEVKLLENKLLRSGFLNFENLGTKKTNDTLFVSNSRLNTPTKYIYIYIGEDFEVLETKDKEIKLPISSIESQMKNWLQKLEQKGYSLSKLQLVNFRKKENKLYVDLLITKERKRSLDRIIVKGYDKFPKSHTINFERLYKKKTFNLENLNKVHNDFKKLAFVNQIKSPEILFTKDSTHIYIYLEKTKPNTFDGFIGFSNTENKIKLNGYLDLKLTNILNSGEKFLIFWKTDGNKQRTFDIKTEIPYIFKSRLGLKAELNIFKQDSTFQNAKTNIDLGYFLNYNTKIYIGYQNTESSDIQNTNNSSISDFDNSFITGQFDYINIESNNLFFREKTLFTFRIGTGKRKSNFENNNQLFGSIHLSHNFYLNSKNSINLRNQTNYLQSNSYIINELFRFGGINSIRGFNENSLQANLSSLFLTEYRYKFNDGIYMHSILDYGYYQDKTQNIKDTLYGVGLGFGVLTKNGLLNFAYANGNTKKTNFQFSNSIVHLSFKSRF